MSSTVAKELSLAWNAAGTYLTGDNACTIAYSFAGDNCVATLKIAAGNTGYATFNSAAKDILFPNAAAHPTRVTADTYAKSGNRTGCSIALEFDGSSVQSINTGTTKVAMNFDSSAATVTSATKATQIRFKLVKNSSLTMCNMHDSLTFKLYFMQYDLAATAGTGVSNASVSSATGFEGDQVTYTASLQSGYTFDGWYNGNTKISSNQTYTHTVSGDITLQARATAPTTATVTTAYNGRNIATETITPPVNVNYGGSVIASIGRGQSKTLNCNGKIMGSNVTIGGKTLNCNGKYMTDNITISVT